MLHSVPKQGKRQSREGNEMIDNHFIRESTKIFKRLGRVPVENGDHRFNFCLN